MSVQTQIDRISGAVSAALAALSEKGVTVPEGTKVDGLAELIEAIASGGGGVDLASLFGGAEVRAGTYTIMEDTNKVTFAYEEPFTSKPTYIFVGEVVRPNSDAKRIMVEVGWKNWGSTHNNANFAGLGSDPQFDSSNVRLGSYSGFTETTGVIAGISPYMLLAGTTYAWIAIGGMS